MYNKRLKRAKARPNLYQSFSFQWGGLTRGVRRLIDRCNLWAHEQIIKAFASLMKHQRLIAFCCVFLRLKLKLIANASWQKMGEQIFCESFQFFLVKVPLIFRSIHFQVFYNIERSTLRLGIQMFLSVSRKRSVGYLTGSQQYLPNTYDKQALQVARGKRDVASFILLLKLKIRL